MADGPFLKVELRCKAGKVADVDMPPFCPMPEVVVWGTRVFTRHGGSEDAPVYMEAFAYCVPLLMGPECGEAKLGG